MVAQGQVQQIVKAIETTRESLDETDDLWPVLKGLFGGVVDELKSIAWVSEPVGTEAAKVAGFKEGEVWLSGAAAKAGIDAPGAAAGLGTAGTVMAGYALLIYAGYTTLEKMGDAITTLRQQLKALKEKALPLAHAQLDAARRVVTIAKLQQAIAEVDAKLARDLMHFQRVRFLNSDFWSEMLALARRMLQRYLYLGGRYAWLAERALAYEQARSLNLIRLDYFPRRFHGIGGAQLLKGDLVELEAARLGALQAAKPIVRTYSMVFDFPLQFAALKRSGRCLFHTSDAELLEAYPGTYGHRVRAVSLWVQTITGGAPFKGMLTHTGFSSITDRDGNRRPLLRSFEGQPVSGFRLRDDLAVFGLPNEALFTFEGSGVDADWILEFPTRANPFGLHDVADVILRFDITSSYDSELYSLNASREPGLVERSFLFSAAKNWPQALAALQGDSPNVTMSMDMALVDLPLKETDRKIRNLAVLVVSLDALDGPALFAVGSSQPVTIHLSNGVALSNAAPLEDPVDPSRQEPLNAFVGMDLVQVFRLTVDKAAFPGVDFAEVKEVLLALSYDAIA
jgi:hypothetical protein